MILGVLVVAYLIGQVTALIHNLDRFTAQFASRLYHFNRCAIARASLLLSLVRLWIDMKTRSMPYDLRVRVRKYLAHEWSTRKGVDPRQVRAYCEFLRSVSQLFVAARCWWICQLGCATT